MSGLQSTCAGYAKGTGTADKTPQRPACSGMSPNFVQAADLTMACCCLKVL